MPPMPPTLLARVAAALGETKAGGWIEAARVVVDGEIATDPQAAPPPMGKPGISAAGSARAEPRRARP